MTNNEMKVKLYEVFKTLNDEQVIELWDAYHQTLTCEVDKCFFTNTTENREAILGVCGINSVLTSVFCNNHGFNLDCEYFRFSPEEQLIEGFSLRQARRLISDEHLDAIANNLVIERETLGLPYVESIINGEQRAKLRSDVLDILQTEADEDEVIVSFDNFITETVECSKQIFTMDELEDVWFNIVSEDFSSALRDLTEAIKEEFFDLNDPYWEMTEEGIQSFEALCDSNNFHNYWIEYANYIIDTRDYDGLSEGVAEKLDDLFSRRAD